MEIIALAIILKNILLHLYWWQIKEYRLDRMIAHLETEEGKKLFFGPLSLARVFILIALLFIPLLGNLLFIIFYLILFIKLFLDILKKRLVFPKFTLRIWQTLGLLLLINIWLFKTNTYLALSLIDNVIPVTVAGATLLMGILLKIYKFRVVRQAKQKVTSMENLIVIGITGSFGKTSTKEFLRQILESKFRVLATPGHVNTEIGIAQFILKNLKPSHQILIVEMGAYKKGEIKTICNIVQPKIGILTAISSQHLSLFGSINNIIQAKFELIDSLPQNGLAVLNADNEHIFKKAKSYQVKKLFYSTYPKSDIYAANIKISPENLSFDINTGSQKQHILSKLLGGQNVPNLLASFGVCLHLDLSLKEIAAASLNLKPAQDTMEITKSKKGATLINDTYNINPEGIKAALDYLTSYKDMKKIVVLSPMIELGKETKKAYEGVEKKALQDVDKLLWTNQNFDMKEFDRAGFVILFEGKQAKRILEALK